MEKKKGNLGYALKTVYNADKRLLIFTLIKNSMEQIFYVFFFVYLTKYIYNCIEKNIPYEQLFTFLLIACSLHVVIHFMCAGYEAYRKVKTPEVYRYIFHRVMELSENMELKDFEDPAFYDTYAKALDRCAESAIDIAIRFGVFLGNIISSIMAMVIVVSVDPFLMVFMIVPIVASFYFGSKSSKAQYTMEKEITRDKRIAEYVKRVFYEKKYAAKIRLYDVDKLLEERQEEAVEAWAKTSLFYRMKMALCAFLPTGAILYLPELVAISMLL